jgi:hypothetical protein
MLIGVVPDILFQKQRFLQWILRTKLDGAKVEVTGYDLFTFKNGKIAIKNSYPEESTATK